MDVVTGIAVAAGTVVVVVGALVTAGFVLLFRRRGDRGFRPIGDSSMGSISKRAGTLLVRLDDALREADDELGYAIAQFGAAKARPYGDAVAAARTKVTEAFRLRQALDDAQPDSDRQKREWTLQIIALCEQAEKALGDQDARFASLRRQEVNAAGTLQDLRSRVTDTAARVEGARTAIAELEKKYVPEAVADVASNPDAAEALLVTATSTADAAAPAISQSGVNDVSGPLQDAAQSAHRADQLLDAVERTARDLRQADDALTALRASAQDDLVEARVERDSAPDADTGRAIIDAVAGVEAILTDRSTGRIDPVAELDRLGDAIAGLDAALASARNQTQRLEHARAAYVGTLVSAKSQIAAARDYIGSHRVGVDARTRLAEAERQLELAEAETDPVDALDTIRRAVTHARDADALARYDSMGGR